MRPDPRLGSELGPYRIESVIGRGGMGVVYLATHTGLDRRVALKLLTPDYADDEGFRTRFLRESKLAASIDHPNIIPVYDAGELDGTYYLAMRYVEGVDLETRLRTGPLAPREAVHLLAQVASALDAAHEAGLVHRDVKPANILIASGKSVDRADHAYLTDFGLTKHRGSQTGLTRAGGFIGTLEYIAPEQIEGRAVDGRADQYALAAIAVGCLTGEPPFPRDSDVAIINAHLHDAPPILHQRRPELPAGVDAVIARGLAKRPDERYPDCKAFVDDLRAALGVTETQTTPRSAAPRDRRVPLLVGALVVLALLAVVGFGLASGGGIGLGASPSAELAAASPGLTAASPSADASPTEDVFPNAAEAALLLGVPVELRSTCTRGPYTHVEADQGGATPLASLTCLLPISSGANEVVIRRFTDVGLVGSVAFTPDAAISAIESAKQLRPGDCAKSTRAGGRWTLNGVDEGGMACFVNVDTGDAILYWSYKDDAMLVRATNQKGDSKALYDFFSQTAQFIVP